MTKCNKLFFVLTVAIVFYPIQNFAQEIQIDHIISVFPDLDKTIRDYENIGFSVKKGFLHKNGLLNAHIKFSNNSYYELMSVQGEPKDTLAKFYKANIKNGGGLFLAISGISTKKMESILTQLNQDFEVSRTNNWSYITFPENSDLAHIFFIEYHPKLKGDLKLPTHKNGVHKINHIVIEGNDSVAAFFKKLGLKPKDTRSYSSTESIMRFATNTGDIILLPRKKTSNRYRVKTISFGDHNGKEILKLNLQ